MAGPIWILGTGIYSQTSLPGSLAMRLRNVSKVYSHITANCSTWLPPELGNAEFVCLADAFTNHESRLDNYVRIANTVIAGAKSAGEIVYYTPGSPVVYDRIPSLIREMALKSGMQCHVIPAVSCIDAVLAFIGEDAAPGLQVIEARWLVKNGINLDSRVNSLLVQVCGFSTDGMPRSNLNIDSLAPLGQYLQRMLPPDSPALFVRAPLCFGADPGYLRGTTISELGKIGVVADLQDTSLFIPSPLYPNREAKPWWKAYARTRNAASCVAGT